MRGIAQRAGVDPALVHHCFGTKDGPFRGAVSSRIDISALFESLAEETERTPTFTSLVSAQLVGVAILRHVLAVEPLASLSWEELMERLIPAIEVYFGRLPQA